MVPLGVCVKTSEELWVWHLIEGTDVGPLRFFVPSVVLQILDIALLAYHIRNQLLYGSLEGLLLIIGIHIISACILALFYWQNESEIDDGNMLFETPKWRRIRGLAQLVFAITPIFIIWANWKDLKLNHAFLRSKRILREPIDSEEIEVMVRNKRREYVKRYFDIIHVFFKTIPQCIVQLCVAISGNVIVKIYQWSNVMKLFTFVLAVVSASNATAGHDYARKAYLKSREFKTPNDLTISKVGYTGSVGDGDLPSKLQFWTMFLRNAIVVGSRIYALMFVVSVLDQDLWPSLFVCSSLVSICFTANLLAFNTSCVAAARRRSTNHQLSLQSTFVNSFVQIFCQHSSSLSVGGGLRNTLVHQSIPYLACLISVLLLMAWSNWLHWPGSFDLVDQIMTQLSSSSKDSTSRSRVGHRKAAGGAAEDVESFTLAFSNIIIYWSDKNLLRFRDVFSNQSVLLVLIISSFSVSILYALFLKLIK